MLGIKSLQMLPLSQPLRMAIPQLHAQLFCGPQLVSQCSSSSSSNKILTAPDFGDHRQIFSGKSNTELWRSFLVLQACGIDMLVANSTKLLKVGERMVGSRALGVLVSPFYNQFVAGDSALELTKVRDRLREQGVTLMLAPMLESDLGDGGDSCVFSTNLSKMISFILLATTAGGKAPAVCQAKVTGHISADIMEKVSTHYAVMTTKERLQAIQWVATAMATVNRSIIAEIPSTVTTTLSDKALLKDSTSADLLEPSEAVTGPLAKESPFKTLTSKEHKELIAGLRRMSLFGMLCEHLDVVMAIDAEFTYVNPGINLVALALMKRHNKNKPLIWNTYQAYLKSTSKWLSEDVELSEALGCCFGVKLVRGAYMDHERQHAITKGLPDPINDSYDDTNNNYNKIAEQQMLAVHANPPRRSILLATHNERSVRLALETSSALPALPQSCQYHCSFAQIYGMADNISMPLASTGTPVYKSVPLGSVQEVMPYLTRRASENRTVLQGARRERQLLLREIRDRITFTRK